MSNGYDEYDAASYAAAFHQYGSPTSGDATTSNTNAPDGPQYDPMTASNAAAAAAAAQHMLFSFSYHHPPTGAGGGGGLFHPSTTSTALAVLQQQQQQQSNSAFHDSYAAAQQHLLTRSSSDPWDAAAAAYGSATPIPNDTVAYGTTPSAEPPSISHAVFTIPHDAPWLAAISLAVPDICVEPLTGVQVLERIRTQCHNVLLHYIPCVSFLVECQQDLRAGLESTTRGRRSLGAAQYYQLYIRALPQQFVAKYGSTTHSDAAYADLQRLRQDAADAQRQGPEAVKANFLGGMKDGESWGLRKWLSRHGQGLGVCTDLECISTALRTHADALDASVQQALGAVVRPMAEHTLQRLRNEIPASYQKHSTAHPYLPYFHRLEAALRNMTRLYQENEVILLDDSDDDDVVEVVEQPPRKRKSRAVVEDEDTKPPARRKQQRKQASVTVAAIDDDDDGGSSSGESAGDEIEVVDRSPWPLPLDTLAYRDEAYSLGNKVFDLAGQWDMNCLSRPPSVSTSDFWRGGNFGEALRLFGQLLQQHEIIHFVDRIDDDRCIMAGHPPFSHVIKHPNIALRDVANSLFDQSGVLHTDRTLDHWNMFNAKDLLQAIDLVLLNSLAYTRVVLLGGTQQQQQTTSTKLPPSTHRSLINGLRKLLWNGIHAIGPPDKSDTPTRRTEQSGFVIYKIHTSRR